MPNRLASMAVEKAAAPPALPAPDDTRLETACAKGIQLQLAGQLDLAADIYNAILQAAPDHAATNYCLGMLHIQSQRPAEGLPYLKAALQAQVGVTDYWLGYLEALLLIGQTTTARSILALARRQGIEGPAVEDFARRLGAQNVPPTNAGRLFLIAAPPYSDRSAGIRVLHTLCNELNLAGHTAHLILFRFTAQGGVTFFTPVGDADYCPQLDAIQRLPACDDMTKFRALIDDAYVIYPEVIAGNPLNARRVVRYVLNSPASNGYPMREGEDDYIVAFSSAFWPNPHSIATLMLEDPLFNDENSRPAMERTMDITYIGKGATFGDCFRLQGSILIERSWPADKESLSIMLRNTRYFYTWDTISQTNLDALYCGAIPVAVRWTPPLTAAAFDPALGPFPYAECTVQNGAITVAHEPEQFDKRRRRYLDYYRALARTRHQTVRKLAADIEQYFQRAADTDAAGFATLRRS